MAGTTGSGDRDPRVEAYAEALLRVVEAEGHLGDVEDELYRFSQTVKGNDDLRMALSNPALRAEQRMAIVEELLGKKALRTSAAIASFLVGIGRGRDLPAVVDRFVELAAATREHVVAEVRSAIPLDGEQQQRLAHALGRATGKQVEVKVVVDPAVLGGLVAQIGDTVIDGSVRHRLDEFKERI